MRRNVSLEEISDGKLYAANDMVKADCLGCKGCSDCCHGMGDTILLDPYDIWRLQGGLQKDLPAFMAEGSIALGVVDGVILPHLTMAGAAEQCGFLDENGRCGIHAYRPGICRLFPLGRYYEGEGFRYFLQTKECGHPKAKVKVSKWLDVPELSKYGDFIRRWHGLLKEAERVLEEAEDETLQKNFNLFFLKTFYMTPYAGEKDFYGQFSERLERYRRVVA